MPPKKTKNSPETSKISDSFKRVKSSRKSAPTKQVKSKNLNELEEILREFDLNVDFGPFVGILRSERYKRAISFNLPVKSQVKQIFEDSELLKEHPELDLSIWHDLENII
jgi:hypothetical protein